MTVARAALLVGVSEQALRKRIRKGTLPAHKLRRGSQIITMLSPSELACAYPEIVGRTPEPGAPGQASSQPGETHPARADHEGQAGHAGQGVRDAEGGGAGSAGETAGVAQALERQETVIRLREGLATAEAARSAAESRCGAAEVRAQVAEEKFERALVQRGDDISKARKDVERQSLQMAMEIARANIQALPEAIDHNALAVQRRWLGGVALTALLVAGGVLIWGSRLWGDLRDTRGSQATRITQVDELQTQLSQTLGLVVDAEAGQLVAREEALQTLLAVSDERRAWRESEVQMQAQLGAARETSETLRNELAIATLQQRAIVNLSRSKELILRLFAY